MTIGDKIKNYRKLSGLTQKQLGEISGTSERTIQQYESGKRQPRIEQLSKIASALDIPVSVFLDELSESQRIKSTWEWIQDNTEKRKELLIEILKTHNYRVGETDRFHLTITDYQGFDFYVNREEFQDMIERCDKDIRYNVEKLLNESKPLGKG